MKLNKYSCNTKLKFKKQYNLLLEMTIRKTIMNNEIEQITAANKINKFLGTNIKPIYIIMGAFFVIFELFYLTTQYLEQLYGNTYIDNTLKIQNILYENIDDLCLTFNIPILIFYTLNKLFVCSFWDFLGITVNDNMISSSELKHNNKLIYYPKNAYSSSCQICAGAYLMIRSYTVINYKTTFILGFNMYFMGIFSYLWWSSSKEIIRVIDHLFMELHCISLSFSFISLLGFSYDYNIENDLLLITLFYAYFRFRLLTRAKLGILILFINMSSLLLIISIKNVGNINLYYGGFISILFGLFMKTIDKLYDFTWGTALFHLFASLTFIFSYEWSQTLPIQSF